MMEEYYANPHVRARLVEFLGGTSLDEATCAYVTVNGHAPHVWYDPRPVTELWGPLTGDCDVARSLWDHASLIAHLDIEYVNFDHPAQPYLDPARTFDVQRPVASAIEQLRLEHGIAPLHILSDGRAQAVRPPLDGPCQ